MASILTGTVGNYPAKLTTIEGIGFTPREIDVITSVEHGKEDVSELARFLNISRSVIDHHLTNIVSKLQLGGKPPPLQESRTLTKQKKIISFLNASDLENKKFRCQHFVSLRVEEHFYNALKKIGDTIALPPTLYIDTKTCPENFPLGEFKKHLQKANITVEDYKEGAKGIEFILRFVVKQKSTNIEATAFSLELLKLGKINSQNPNKNLPELIIIDEQFDYFLGCLTIIRLMASIPEVEKIIAEFEKEHKNFLASANTKNTLFKRKNVLVGGAIFLVFVYFIGMQLFDVFHKYFFSNKESTNVRSSLQTPIESSFLKRPRILKQMEKCLQGHSGIQAIALVGVIGVGGAGKTTLARYYGKLKEDISLIWELNAQNHHSLANSFWELAYVLADTRGMKDELSFVQQIQNPRTKEIMLLNFIKHALHKKPNWLLIYDNVESFSSISHMFPTDPSQWGAGKVIITTRNEHIHETSYLSPKDVIYVEQLNKQEKLSLFCKILYDKESSMLGLSQRREVIKFLKYIPPFPLDVSVAAYFIKNTQLTFKQYLAYIKEYSNNYEMVQLKLLKEVTDYDKTRYGIISSTIEKLNTTNPHFEALFFLITLLDSQNIPLSLLRNFKNTVIVDDFVYHLRQKGLLIRELFTNFAQENKVISLHRSTQNIGRIYLRNTIANSTKSDLITQIIKAVERSYNDDCIQNKQTNNLVLLIPHLEVLLNNIKELNLPDKKRHLYDLLRILGNIYYDFIRNLTKAEKLFLEALQIGGNEHPLLQKAQILSNLGEIYTTTNKFEDALKYIIQSQKLCKKLKNVEVLQARNLQIMGTAYRKTNNFQKALNALSEALEIIQKIKGKEERVIEGEIYTQLGFLYLAQYLNKKESKIARVYGKKALKLINGDKFFHTTNSEPPSYVTCVTGRFRWKHSQIIMISSFNYKSALKGLKEAEYIAVKNCAHNLHLKGRIYGEMGKVFLRLNELQKAEEILTACINSIGVGLGIHCTWVATTWRAEARIRLKKYREAYKDALSVLNLKERERNNLHDLWYWTASYHAAVAAFRLQDNQKSCDHFQDFLQNIKIFCKKFLSTRQYKELLAKKAFTIYPYKSEKCLPNIRRYLLQAQTIFSAIYGEKKPFIKDYVALNVIS